MDFKLFSSPLFFKHTFGDFCTKCAENVLESTMKNYAQLCSVTIGFSLKEVRAEIYNVTNEGRCFSNFIFSVVAVRSKAHPLHLRHIIAAK